jgi:hypothetical protein
MATSISRVDANLVCHVPKCNGNLSAGASPPAEDPQRGRELRALTAAAKQHPRAALRLLVLDRDAFVRAQAPAVEVQPAYEWLLAATDKD